MGDIATDTQRASILEDGRSADGKQTDKMIEWRTMNFQMAIQLEKEVLRRTEEEMQIQSREIQNTGKNEETEQENVATMVIDEAHSITHSLSRCNMLERATVVAPGKTPEGDLQHTQQTSTTKPQDTIDLQNF
eukprot:TRINITY_DN4782_c0_g1_i1.p1 TRINITY_DN4782_c0_g1~~TRINITY_DN4782_c0_g1_i1.p1  ORF type:complete len:153 (-),score=40.91 TRINITY_DN4782_c0_g1_i1:787-1185(-)